MEAAVTLRATLVRLTWRMGVAAFARRLANWLLWAIGLGTAIALVDKLIYLGINAAAVTGVVALLAAAGALAAVFIRGEVNVVRAARETDRRLGLSDRLTSALQLRKVNGPWADAVERDAEEHVRGLSASSAFPVRATVGARLLVPALIVFGLVLALPGADLLGRRGRLAERQVEAERAQDALAGAVRGMAPGALGGIGGADDEPDPIGALRLALVKIDKDLLAGKLDDARRIELSEQLRRLAELMDKADGGTALAAAIRRTAEALSGGGQDAASQLRALQEELARREEALKKAGTLDEETQRLIAAKRAELRSANTSERGMPAGAGAKEGPERDLVELAAAARKPPQTSAGPAEIIYSPIAAGVPAADAPGEYESAARSARAEIETGGIPPGYVRLVRDYFDSIKPAGR